MAPDAPAPGRRRRWAFVAIWVVAGGVGALALLVYLWPARALVPLVERVDGLTVWDVRGRWWRGEARMAVGELTLGRLAWQWAPAGLASRELRFDWQLKGRDHALGGTGGLAVGGWALNAAGRVAATVVNPALAAYDINLGGDFAFEAIALRAAAGATLSAAGASHWSGGVVHYRIRGRRRAVLLPAMTGRLAVVDGEPTLAVASAAGERLFDVRLAADGWIHLALTKRFLDVAGHPWPGAAADDAVVVEIAERLAALPAADLGQR